MKITFLFFFLSCIFVYSQENYKGDKLNSSFDLLITDTIHTIPVMKPQIYEMGNPVYEFYMYNYAVKNLGFPNIDNYSDEEIIREYRQDTKNWYKNNHEYNGIFQVLRKEDLDNLIARYLKEFLSYKEILIKKYPPKPVFIDTGNPVQDEINYKNKLKEWSENHPDYPKYIDTGQPCADKERLRKARVAFYDKYIKEN